MEQWCNDGGDEGSASAGSVKHTPHTDRPAIETGLFIWSTNCTRIPQNKRLWIHSVCTSQRTQPVSLKTQSV